MSGHPTQATVHIPPQLRDLTGGVSEASVSAGSLREVIQELDARFPGLAGRVLHEGGIAPGLAVSIDHAVTSRGLRARVSDGSVVHILPAISGG